MVKKLLYYGANVDRNNEYGGSALYLACREGHHETVSELIKFGANVNKRMGRSRKTVLMIAAKNGRLKTVKVLVEQGADINAKKSRSRGGGTALKEAIDSVHREVAQYLADNGAKR